MCNFVLATAHAYGMVPLSDRQTAGVLKSESGSRVYTGRVIKMVNIIPNTGMEMGWINFNIVRNPDYDRR